MKFGKSLAVYLLGIFSSIASLAQSGILRGNVFEEATGEPMIGVTVLLKGTSFGAVTDFDGKFNIKAAPGAYEVQISFISYRTINIPDVEVIEGQVSLLENIGLAEDVQELEAVVITADVIRNSESALLTVKKKSANLLDGISSAKFKQIGDSDASEAVKRVTGVSVEGGKYVFVRGLGDRYTKTMLNSVDIPGLDPDRNSLQIDIFPTTLIENMVVMKTAVAELPADFTGGVVNIETKDFPEEKVFDVSASVGYNPNMHFNSDFLVGNRSSTDFLGFDNGDRELPKGSRNIPFPSPSAEVSDASVNAYLRNYGKTLGASKQNNFMNFSLGLTSANQYNFDNGNSLGYIFSTTYRNSLTYFDKVIFGEYQQYAEADQFDFQYATIQDGVISERSVLLGGLAGLAYKTSNSKIKLNVLHLQNGEERAAQFFIDDNGSAVGKSGFFGSSDNLEYNQRGLTNLLLNGEHFLGEDRTFSIDWRISPTISNIVDPDIRKTAFTYTSSDTVFSPGAAGDPSRIWRFLDEFNIVSKVDLRKELKLFGEDAQLKFGASHTFKERDFEILAYNMQFNNGLRNIFEGDPNSVMLDENLYPNGPVSFVSGNPNPNSNEFNSTSTNTALYISAQVVPLKNLKAIIGLRAENYVQKHTGRDAVYAGGDTINGNILDEAVVLDDLQLFPSANFIYSLTEIQNLRFSYSRTIARPSFKEMSFAQILDPVSNRTFNGGLFQYEGEWEGDLHETLIDNIDIRWEMFLPRGQLFSVSVFYKRFDDPIELVRIPAAQTTNEFQPRNVGDGRLVGAEVEVRKSLNFLTPSLSNFFISGNFTLVDSKIEMTDTEFNARKRFEKEGETISNIRQMAGQAPYIINGGLSYENNVLGMDGGLFYNVNGPTLTVVGGGLFPDVFSEPFHSLNFNMNKTIGKDRRGSISINATNILNDLRESFFTGYKAQDEYFERRNPGRSFGTSFKYSF